MKRKSRILEAAWVANIAFPRVQGSLRLHLPRGGPFLSYFHFFSLTQGDFAFISVQTVPLPGQTKVMSHLQELQPQEKKSTKQKTLMHLRQIVIKAYKTTTDRKQVAPKRSSVTMRIMRLF